MLYREYPEKILQKLQSAANALPIGIPAEGLGSGTSSAGDSNSSGGLVVLPILGESVFLKDIFRLKDFTMHILQSNADGQGVCGIAEIF